MSQRWVIRRPIWMVAVQKELNDGDVWQRFMLKMELKRIIRGREIFDCRRHQRAKGETGVGGRRRGYKDVGRLTLLFFITRCPF